MRNQIEFVGTFLGKVLYKYDPKIECSEDDFIKFVSQFNRVETLRLICSLSRQLFHNQKQIFSFGEVPVREEILYDFGFRVIKYCGDKVKICMSDEQAELALKMCHKLSDTNLIRENHDAIEILTKISYNQFIFQQKNFNNFARNYYLYTNLWNRFQLAHEIDILCEIEDEIGLPFDHALLFAYALAENKHGHFWLYDQKAIDEINNKTGLSVTVEHHKKFIAYCSGVFEKILNQDGRLPPFMRYPIIETKSSPLSNKGEVFMIVSQQFLHDRLTSSLYFSLSDRFNEGGKTNKFKEIFGYVFQEYVGELLKFYFKKWQVIPEIKYKKKKGQQDSVDWFVRKDDKLIMIEVKQSSIFIGSKYKPSMKSLVSDLEKTVMHAVEQLNISESDIKENRYPELSKFSDIRTFVKLVVINDPLFNANFLLKSILKNKVDDIAFQIININDFEALLSCQKHSESLFAILFYKSIEHNEIDFNEYICNVYPDARSDIEFLVPTWDRFFKNKLNIRK